MPLNLIVLRSQLNSLFKNKVGVGKPVHTHSETTGGCQLSSSIPLHRVLLKTVHSSPNLQLEVVARLAGQ